uniref:Prolyl 4-hydroxylase alpha subunit domain-containing protein n=1 Tax=Alexandrium monilatum TaxID=311494 RepID=A0A7S4QRN7_9DINO
MLHALTPADAPVEAPLDAGERVEVEWPCEAEDGSGEVRRIWFSATVAKVQEEEAAGSRRRPRFLLRFDDGGEAWSSLRRVAWRRPVEESHDMTGFVHLFGLEEELLAFCDELHERREEYGDKTRGDAACGEPLQGGLISVVVRRDAVPASGRELYLRLHQRCVEEVARAWPGWVARVGGRGARVRPSQDLRLLQYSEGANFKAHVDSGWACQALVYLNEDFSGGYTEFPNLGASYRPRRGRVLLWRSLFVGHKAAAPGSLDDHPACHVAGAVYGGVKRVVSIHLVVT